MILKRLPKPFTIWIIGPQLQVKQVLQKNYTKKLQINL